MGTAAVDVPGNGERWLRAWREIDLPTGWRAEVIFNGSITVTPPPSPPHNLIADLIDDVLRSGRPSDTGILQTLGVRIDAIGKGYIPDLVVVPRAALVTDEPEISAEHVLLAVEITSKDNADHDRKAKRWGYAHGHVPLYLLVDRWERPNPTVTLFADPENGDYAESVRVPFGKSIRLPAPFDVEIDTSQFPPGR
jgi:Uma2 family endonuclease